MTHQPETARELASLAANAGRALQDEKRHYEIACQENARLRAAIARIRQMADAWEQQLPDVIRTPAVVSALRAALESAEPAAVSAAVAPPTNQTADEVDADTVANRAAQVITTMGAEIRELTHSRDRYRMAWLSARHRVALRRMADETATEPPQPSLRERHRAAWHALTPDQQAARLAELDAIDEPAGARQDATAADESAPGSTRARPCRTFVSGGAVWCCEEGEADCPCVCHQPAAGARQDGAES